MRWLPGSLVPPNTSGGGEYFLNERWVARGLVLVVIGDKWITPSGTRIMTPVNNPARLVGPRGRVLGFGSIDAGNTTARMDGFYLPSSKTGARSYFGTMWARDTGLNGLGRVFQHSIGDALGEAGNEAIYFGNSTFFLSKVVSTSNALQVGVNSSLVTVGRWVSYGFSCHFEGATDPSMITPYVNGLPATATTNNTGTGSHTLGIGGTTMVFGNRPSDSARSWNGQIGLTAVFDARLTAAEQAVLHANPNQLLVSSDRGLWAPAVSTVVIYRPGTDITTTDWTAVPGPGFYTAIDEDVASDTDYIQSPNRATPDDRPFEAGLSGTMPAGTWDVSIRTERLAGVMGVRVELMDGTTVTGTAQTNITLTGAQDYVIPVTTTANSTKVRIKVYDGGLP